MNEINLDITFDVTYSPVLITKTITKTQDMPPYKSQDFTVIGGQTSFLITKFTVTQYSRVYIGGFRKTEGFYFAGQNLILSSPVADGTIINVDEN